MASVPDPGARRKMELAGNGTRTAEHRTTGLGRGELLLIFGFWFLMATLSAVGSSLDPRGRMSQPGALPPNVLAPFIQYSLWALLTPLVFWLVARTGDERPNRVGRLVLFLLLGVLFAAFADVISAVIRFQLFAPPRRPGSPTPNVFAGLLRFWFLDDFALYLAVLGAGLARDYWLRLRVRHEEAVLLRGQLAEARLGALRSQLDPHFLFNTLNAVSALVERDPAGVRRMIARLSELLRRSLEGTGEQEVPLRQEVDFVRRYLEIMQIRFQGGLQVEVRTEAESLDAMVPALVLQPLVENAIKHGMAEGDHHGRVEITSRLEGEWVVMEVLDEGSGVREPVAEGVGLRNTRERLEALYGGAYRLEVSRREAEGTRAEVRVPFHTAEELRPGLSAEGT